MPSSNPLTVFVALFADLILILIQICWQATLFAFALIPCGAAIHPSLRCKMMPWTSASSRHRCRCPSLVVAPFLTSTFCGPTTARTSRTWQSRPQPPRPCPLRRTARAPRRSRAARAPTPLSPETLEARLRHHLLPCMDDPAPSLAVTPPPPYPASECPPPLLQESEKEECLGSRNPNVDQGLLSSEAVAGRRDSHPPRPPPRRRRRCRRTTPSAPPTRPRPDNSDTE